jgi:hypothetical protein
MGGVHCCGHRIVPTLPRITTALADAGYDSEANHRYAREQRGVRSIIPAEIGRPSSKPPTGRYRSLRTKPPVNWSV